MNKLCEYERQHTKPLYFMNTNTIYMYICICVYAYIHMYYDSEVREITAESPWA